MLLLLKSSFLLQRWLSLAVTDAELRYYTTEKEVLVILRRVEQVRWLVFGAKYPTLVYTDHIVVRSVSQTLIFWFGYKHTWLILTNSYITVNHPPPPTFTKNIAQKGKNLCVSLRRRRPMSPDLETGGQEDRAPVIDSLDTEEPFA